MDPACKIKLYLLWFLSVSVKTVIPSKQTIGRLYEKPFLPFF